MSTYIYASDSNPLKLNANGQQVRVFTNALDILTFALFLPATANLNQIFQLLSDPKTSMSFIMSTPTRNTWQYVPIFPEYSLPCSLQLVDTVEKGGLQNDRSADALPRLVEYESLQRQAECQKWRKPLPCLKEQKTPGDCGLVQLQAYNYVIDYSDE